MTSFVSTLRIAKFGRFVRDVLLYHSEVQVREPNNDCIDGLVKVSALTVGYSNTTFCYSQSFVD